MTRRLVIQMLLASGDFWNRRSSSEWSADEIERLLHNSPWAKDVNADFDTDAEGGLATVGRGGMVEAPKGPARRRQPVRVIWESAQPVLDAKRGAVAPQFAGRYVISAGEIPMSAMERRRRDADPNDTPADRRRRMVENLSASATLEAKGKAPVQPGIVEAAPHAPATWLFGFSRELLEIDRDDREVVFTLQTGFVTLRAKFEPKQMMYRGMLAV